VRDERRAVAEARVGRVLRGKWTLVRLLEIGGMAAVYEAVHKNGTRAALKMLHPVFGCDDDMRERFQREGYVANKVGHPNAVLVLEDDATEQGVSFLVMELLEGESLKSRLDRTRGKMPVQDVLALADAVLDVLAAAHAKGIVHRDIKPGNLFLTTEGHVKVLDFGLARLRDAQWRTTGTGVILGTSSYMSPEQARGKSSLIDARSDIYGLGAVMFRAITGRQVRAGATVSERLVRAMAERAPSLGMVAGMPDPVVALVDRALAYEREARFADARAMQRAVREAVAHLEGQSQLATIPSMPVAAIASPAPPPPDPDESSGIDVSIAFMPEEPEPPMEDDGQGATQVDTKKPRHEV
jgi:serine/threonine-protein kinase